MENSKQNDGGASGSNSKKKALMPQQEPAKKGQEDSAPFELTKIGSVEGPLQFRELLRDEHLDMGSALVVGPVSITSSGGTILEGKISSNSASNMTP